MGLPNNWEEVQLIDLLDVFENGSRPKGGVSGILEGIPSLGGEHLNDSGGFKFDKIKYVPVDFASKMTKGKIEIGDILIVKDGATTGKTSFVNETFPFDEAFVNEHVFICRPFKNLNNKSLYYFLFGTEGQNRILENFTGTAQGGINKKFASNTLIPFPPRPEQNRIVAKLDALFAQHETIKNRLEKIPTLLKNFKQQVLTQAVTGKLTDVKMNEVELGGCLDDVKYGTSKKSSYETDGIPVFRIPNIENGEINDEDLKFSSLDDKEMEKLSLQEDDILIIRSNGSVNLVGRSAIVRKRHLGYSYAGYLIRLRCNKNLLPSYLNYLFQSTKLREQIVDTSRSTSGVNNINSTEVKRLLIYLPSSINEQQEIVNRVESLFAKVAVIEQQYKCLKSKVDTLPQSILHKAFKGELLEQLPTDGDARDLLKEIEGVKKTRENKKQPTKKKKVVKNNRV